MLLSSAVEFRCTGLTQLCQFLAGSKQNPFQQKQAGLNDRTVITFRDYLYNPETGIDVALAVYLLARKLSDKPLPETEMNLATYDKTIIEFRNHSGARLCAALDNLNKMDKAQILVRALSKGRVTVVNGPVYDKWIKDGGENEVLFGNCLNKTPSVSIPDINSKAAELKALWNRHAILTATIERNKLFVRTKEILARHFQSQMRDVNQGEESTLANRERIIMLFNECLDNIREDELSNIWDVCLKLVCHSRFPHTEARRILLGIDRIKKENPGVDVREAAAISTIEYIANWLSTQMRVQAL